MNGFTSGKRATLGLPLANHDHEPYVVYIDHRATEERTAHWRLPRDRDGEDWAVGYFPRPEFAVLDNPILSGVRSGENTPEGALDMLHDDARDWWLPWITDAQIDQARRVLAKMAALS